MNVSERKKMSFITFLVFPMYFVCASDTLFISPHGYFYAPFSLSLTLSPAPFPFLTLGVRTFDNGNFPLNNIELLNL